ncbi:MAG: SufD family Fe-S cluster assembly protein [Treponema sp.]|nr:SufD family Fe-S cluster assembly protein [Treponema sp.]
MASKLNINHLPTPTWNWLKINSSNVDIPSVKFVSATPRIEGIVAGVDFSKNVQTSAYDNVETSCGNDVRDFLISSGINHSVLTIQKNVKLASPIVIDFSLSDKSASANSFIVKAEENSFATVVMIYESDENASGTQIIRTICDAQKNAHIHLIRVQLLGKGFTQIDDSGTVFADEGNVTHTHIVLGGLATYTGSCATLNSYKSEFRANTAYYCRGEQLLDMNYLVRCIAKKVFCNMVVKGTLQDKAQKIYRGSIDFKGGCKGAEGEEIEDVLVLSKDAINKSIPLILCDEEDIAGEHASTIGKLSKEILFYMQSRGISKTEAEKIMTEAKIRDVASAIPSKEIVSKIESFMEKVF